MSKNSLGKPLPERRHSEKLKRDLKTLALASTAALFAASGAHAGQIDITNVRPLWDDKRQHVKRVRHYDAD